MKTILFDLDNTLYPEESYVISGFNAVSEFLSNKYSISQEKISSEMINIFNKYGRGNVFDLLVEKLDLNEDVYNLVYIYRYHSPNISLYNDTIYMLNFFKKEFKLGLITDGQVFVQKRKIEALNIENFFDVIIYTDIMGKRFWKPSKEPFKLALNILNSTPSESYYVGDDFYKDFKAPSEMGMKSIRVKYENEMDYWKERGYSKIEADFIVNNLTEIKSIIGCK